MKQVTAGIVLTSICSIFNRPGVAGGVLQTPPLLINSLIHWLSNWWFVEMSSKLYISQTVRGRKLKFWDNAHYPLCFMCHVSRVTCHISRVRCHMSHETWNKIKIKSRKWIKKKKLRKKVKKGSLLGKVEGFESEQLVHFFLKGYQGYQGNINYQSYRGNLKFKGYQANLNSQGYMNYQGYLGNLNQGYYGNPN